jgi:hypothetical protein
MSGITITSTIKRVSDKFSGQMSAKNIKFATAKSLTKMAQGAQEAVRQSLPKERGGPFYIRRQWVVGGIRIKPATRSALEALVYSIDSGGRRSFMGRQERGGTKTNVSGGQHIAIPLRAVKPTPKSIVPQGYKPKNLLRYGPSRGARQEGMKQRGQAFKIKSKNRPGVEWIMMKKGGKYVPAWLLVPRATIKGTNFLSGPAARFVHMNAREILMENFRSTIRSG